MKVFISQPMEGYSILEIKVIRSQITSALKEKYGNDVEVIDSFIKGAPANAKPLWYLGESIKKLSKADIAVFAYRTPNHNEIGILKELARGCQIEERCAKAYDILCLYIAFEKTDFNIPAEFRTTLKFSVGKLSTQRPDFVE